jgi:hypothetical protein
MPLCLIDSSKNAVKNIGNRTPSTLLTLRALIETRPARLG